MTPDSDLAYITRTSPALISDTCLRTMDSFLTLIVLIFCCTGGVSGRFPYPYESRRTLRYVPSSDQPDPGQPLVLTPYIKSGETDQGRGFAGTIIIFLFKFRLFLSSFAERSEGHRWFPKLCRFGVLSVMRNIKCSITICHKITWYITLKLTRVHETDVLLDGNNLKHDK